MAINNDVQDLDNFPGIVKRVTLDVSQVIPVGENGDEKMMMVASTSSYSDICQINIATCSLPTPPIQDNLFQRSNGNLGRKTKKYKIHYENS